jgi:hypothetical protein
MRKWWERARAPIRSRIVDFMIDTICTIGLVALGAVLIKAPIGTLEDDSPLYRVVALLGIGAIIWRWAVGGVRPSKQIEERMDAEVDPQEKLDETWQFRRR